MHTPSYQRFRDRMRARAFREAEELAAQENAQRGGGDAFWLTQQAIALLAAERAEDALRAAEEALARAPRNRYALAVRADARLRLRRVADARADYEELAAAGPLSPRAREGLLQCLAAAGDWSRVLAWLGEGDPSPHDLPWRAKALHALGRTAEAIEACRRWLAAEKDLPAALWLLADLEVALDGAQAVCERHARLARIPGRAPIHREIYASLLKRTGQEAKAAAEYASLAAARPEGRLQRKEAFALAKSGREREAIPLLEELLRENPRDLYLHSSYGAACKRTGELERAWNFYGELLARHPAERGLHGRRKRITRLLEAAKHAPGDAAESPPGDCRKR